MYSKKLRIPIILIFCMVAACVPRTAETNTPIPEAAVTQEPTIPVPTPTDAPTEIPTATPTLSPHQAAERFYLRGVAFQEEGAYDMAIEAFTEAILLDPQFGAAYINRGLCAYETHDMDQAVSDFDQALEIGYDPDSAQMYVNRGRGNAILDDFDSALEDFDHAIEMDPQLAEAFFRRGYVYTMLEEYDLALADLEIAVELDPKDADCVIRRGYVYSLLEEYDKALLDFDRAIELDPDLLWAYQERGIAHDSIGKSEEAYDDFSKAIELGPDNPESYFYRGIHHAKNGSFSEGIEDMEKAVELNPEYTYAYFYLGLMYDDSGNHEKALENLEIALDLDLDPEDEEYAFATIETIQQEENQLVEYIGETSQGKFIALGVRGETIISIELKYEIPGCEEFNAIMFIGEIPIDDDQFVHSAGNYVIEGTFEGDTNAAGSLTVSDLFCEGAIEATWFASSELERPVVEHDIPPGIFPEMSVPAGLFAPDQQLENMDTSVPVITTEGDWVLVGTSPGYSFIPIPSGWYAEADWDNTYIQFSPDGKLDAPHIFIKMNAIGSGDLSSEALMAEAEEGLAGVPSLVIHDASVVDERSGYLFITLTVEQGLERYLIFLYSKDELQGYYHRILIYLNPEVSENYYPIVRAMVEKWTDVEYQPLGITLPETPPIPSP